MAIAPIHTPRPCLQDVSPEAQHDGLRPGMPVDLARRLCPSLRLLAPDPVRIQLAHRRLEDVVARFAPVWEPVRPGRLFLDLTGTGRLFGPAVDTAARIEREVTRSYGITGVLGVGSNKLISRVAAGLIQPPQLCDVRPGSEQTFLAPLPVTLLPGLSRGTARKTLGILDDLNLQTLGQIADIPLSHLEVALGSPAKWLHRWARGIDPSPVLPPVQHPHLDVSQMLQPDEVDDDRLVGILYGLLEELCRRLRAQQRICGRLTLTIHHSDDLALSKHQTFGSATCWEVDMFPHLKTLLFRCFRRRVRIRTVTIRADQIGPAEEQLSLFDADLPHVRTRRLAVALDLVRRRFGNHVIGYGRTPSVNGHCR